MSSGRKDTRANVTLPAGMRPTLDKAQEMLGADSWTGAVQTLLERFTSDHLEALEPEITAVLARVSKALHFAIRAAELEIELETVERAIQAAATDSDPLAFSAFSLALYRQVSGRAQVEAQLKKLLEGQDELKARLERLEGVLMQLPQPQISIKNADADADAGS